ncbi:hypothetical protein [Mesorhizobium sp. M2A.F.Ca.ET.067.02.1.1]|uniref:hypothetical protein n=1 Tax=Mesorhizobium sp. M2A.F.Ca.ET.067.02.1.1 TaxID=2496749 RepID=UPI000FEB77E4|nr:hypothetical protein [Mesorhizobium sp. M2A.F.Ca.ET.067.02.1.1]TIU53120.1 MAG: hypothetical protein E5W35_27765 [Mesorhizobium sp.]
MSQYGVAESAELEILANAVSDYCGKHKIALEEDREQIAVKVMCLYRRGIIDPIRLSEELERVRYARPGW